MWKTRPRYGLERLPRMNTRAEEFRRRTLRIKPTPKVSNAEATPAAVKSVLE